MFMRWRLILSLAYLALMLGVAIRFVQLNILIAITLPIILSILATVSDEGAQSGAKDFRGKEAWQRICVNIHWALLTFYLSTMRGIVAPRASAEIKDIALILALLSLVAGVCGALVVRRFGK